MLPHSYTFKWERIVNGIPFPNDGVQIAVDAQNGRITNYQFTWTDSPFPSPDDAISVSKSNEIFKDGNALSLEYYLPNPTQGSTAILVYKLSDQTNGAIDAITGKPLKLKKGQWYNAGIFSGQIVEGIKADSQNTMNMNVFSMSEAEIKAIKESSTLINENTAIENVKRWIDIPSGIVLTSANLGKFRSSGPIVWNLYWWNQNNNNGKIYSISASVDATDGTLVSMYLNYLGTPSGTKIDKTQAQKIAEEFLQKVQPVRFDETRLNSEAGYQPEKAFNFYYERMVNGIPFSNDNLQVTVDDLGNVTGYNMNWSNVKFEKPEGVIPIDEIENIFLNYRPLVLTYVKIGNQNGSYKIDLVYQPEIKSNEMNSDLINAMDGKPLGWNGTPLYESPHAYHFTDLGTTGYATDIEFLGQAGLFGEYGNTFMPDKNMTVLSLLKNILALKNGIDYENALSNESIIADAISKGLIPAGMNVDTKVNRIILSEILVRFLGLKIAAEAKGIYNLPFKDVNIPENEMGYAALGWSLGFVSTNDNLFMPDKLLTRNDIAISLIKAVKKIENE